MSKIKNATPDAYGLKALKIGEWTTAKKADHKCPSIARMIYNIHRLALYIRTNDPGFRKLRVETLRHPRETTHVIIKRIS